MLTQLLADLLGYSTPFPDINESLEKYKLQVLVMIKELSTWRMSVVTLAKVIPRNI